MRLTGFRREGKDRRSSWRGIWRQRSPLIGVQMADADLEVILGMWPGQLHGSIQDNFEDGL